MAYKRITLRRLPDKTRKLARLINELESTTRKLKNLLPELQSAELAERAMLKDSSVDRKKPKIQPEPITVKCPNCGLIRECEEEPESLYCDKCRQHVQPM